MKITVDQEKPVYRPITITLETAQEYFELLAALMSVTDLGIIVGFRELKMSGLYDEGVDKVHDSLRGVLLSMKDKVKETL